MRFTFTIDEASTIARAEKRAEKRQRREDAKALHLSRADARRNKAARNAFFA